MNITKYKLTVGATALCLIFVLVGFGQTPKPDEVRELQPNQLIERKLAGGQSHFYQVNLKANEYLQVKAEQKGIDIVVRLFDANQKQLVEVDSPNGSEGFEELFFITEKAGEYEIKISVLEENAVVGKYALQWSSNTATEKDRIAVKAKKIYEDGVNLNKPENREAASSKFKEALNLYKQNGDLEGQLNSLIKLGSPFLFENRQIASEYYIQAISTSRKLGDKNEEANLLVTLSLAYDGEPQKQIEYLNQSLQISRNNNLKIQEAQALELIGVLYLKLGNFQKVSETYERKLSISRADNSRNGKKGVVSSLDMLIMAYNATGDKQKAADYENERDLLINSLNDTGVTLSSKELLSNLERMAIESKKSGNYQKSIEYSEQALALAPSASGSRAILLRGIGLSYYALGNKPKAFEYLEKAVLSARSDKNVNIEGSILMSWGGLQKKSGDKQKAIDLYRQSLQIEKTFGEKLGEVFILKELSELFLSTDSNEIAVIYGKQAVNIIQEYRLEIKNFDKESQKTFLKTNESTYRTLADTLILQGRIAEAEEVLGMLKEEEYFSYLRRDDKVAADLKGRISLSPDEKTAFADYEKFADDITRAAQEFGALEKKKNDLPLGASLSADEQKQYDALKAKYDAAVVVFDKFLNDLKVRFGANDKRVAGVAESDTQGILKRMNEPRTVIISTIVGEDRLNLIVTTADTQRAHTVNIKAADLNKLVADFRDAVKNPQADPRALGKKLYDVLFPAALQKDLDNIKADTLVWSLDGTLRYVPMAALWDGKGYLVERYTNAVLTLASRDKITAQTSDRTKWQALGVGVSKRYQNFPALAAVPQELCSVIRDPQKKAFCAALGTRENGVIGGLMLADDEFTLAGFENNLGKVPVIHIASHFALNAGDETDSYLLLGGGEQRRFSLVSLKKTRLDKVELLTMSACNTAMTSGSNSSGVEIEGFGALAQQQGARTVLASLWSVADDSTRDLMSAFYGKLETDANLGKAAALRQAQIELLNGTSKTDEAAKRRGTEIINLNGTANTQPAFKADANAPFAHPYYWSPFILFGNWK